MRHALAAAVALLLLVAPSARAQPRAPAPRPPPDDLLLELTPVAALRTPADRAAVVGQRAGDPGLARADRVDVGAHFWWMAPPAPLDARAARVVTASALALGVDLTGRWAPGDLFLSATPALTCLVRTGRPRADEAAAVSASQVGVGLELAAGKRWSLGARGGLGVSGQVILSTADPSPAAAPGTALRAVAGGLAITASLD